MKRSRILLFCIIGICIFLGCCACASRKTEQAELPHLKIGGTPYSPYFYRDINGEYMGIDVAVAKEACRRIGYTPEFIEISIEDRFVTLHNGAVDCLWSCLPHLRRIHLILSSWDIMMPVMNGLEAVQTIRAMNRTDAADIPIIAVSANDLQTILQPARHTE